jgi:hypothetical protein
VSSRPSATHLILDNYATHKHPKVRAWLNRHPRFHLHFVPTSCSWLNLVERFFRELSQRRLRRGVFKSIEELVHAILAYLDHHNDDPRPSSGALSPTRSSKKSPVLAPSSIGAHLADTDD